MTHTSLISALGLLLSDPGLRRQFATDPGATAVQLEIDQDERDAFLALSAPQLEIQARLLIKKRLREAWKYIPLTFQALQDRSLEIFSAYAQQYWPDSYRRHEQDAYQFCVFLKEHNYPYNRSEWNRLQFLHKKKRYAVSFARDGVIKGRKTAILQFHFRYRFLPTEWRLYLRA